MGTNLAAVSHISSPSAPTSLDLKALSDTGVSSTDNITNDTTATIQGTAGARNHIEVFSGGSSIAKTTANNARPRIWILRKIFSSDCRKEACGSGDGRGIDSG